MTPSPPTGSGSSVSATNLTLGGGGFPGAGDLLRASLACILDGKHNRGNGKHVIERLQTKYLARHGETIGTIAGRHGSLDTLPPAATAQPTRGTRFLKQKSF